MPQLSRVDEHAGQLRADRLFHQHRAPRRIDTAGKPEQHVAVADLGAYACDCIVDDAVRLPGIAAAADFVDEAGVDARALLRVRDYGVELQRSEERRVGKERVSTWRSGWSQYH